MLADWNHQTADWLRHYVFNRVKAKYPKSNVLPTACTFLCSAFWHGFYPMYYFAFFFAGLLTEATKDIYKIRESFNWVPSSVKLLFLHITALQSMNVSGILFGLIKWDNMMNFLTGIYFFWPICSVIIIILLRMTPLRKLAKKSRPKKDNDSNEKKDNATKDKKE
jgi:uncharacterized membrane protein